MNLPCWITHDWDKYGEVIVGTRDCYKRASYLMKYSHTVVSKYQERKCKKCGIVQRTLLDRDTYNKNIRS
jgi:hypothetical protein